MPATTALKLKLCIIENLDIHLCCYILRTWKLKDAYESSLKYTFGRESL